jgi:hypothetical protein
MSFTTMGEIADKYGIRPRHISDLFYARQLDGKRCPVVNGRRLIPTNYVPKIVQALRDAGRLEAVDHA